jgi:5-enolpyruvylshikimate-3-phosphate synthase
MGRRHTLARTCANIGGEAVADLAVRHAPLRGIDVPLEIVPDMIDEFPALFVAAAAARRDDAHSRRRRNCG